ncbi:MAG: ABC transporter permease [Acidimicrobiales bacterium]
MSVAPAVLGRMTAVQRSARKNRYVHSLRSARGLIGLGAVGLVTVIGIVGPFVAPFDPNAQGATTLGPPTLQHLLGTDELGRDLLSRVMDGIRVDLILAFVAVPVASVIGVTVGLLISTRRHLDTVVQRVFDVIFGFPGFILAVLLVEIVGEGLLAIVVTIVVFSIPLKGRITRNAVLQVRDREFVVASRVVGASPRRLLYRHVLPNIMDILIVQLALSMSFAVFIEGGLSFVGLGIQPPAPSLGNVLNEALPYLSIDPLYSIVPMVPIVLLIVGFNLIGDALNRGMLRR